MDLRCQRRRGDPASIGCVFQDLDIALRIERYVLCRRLLSGARLYALVPDSVLYGVKSRTHHRRVYAYGVGAVGIGLFHIGAACIAAYLRRNWFIGSRLDVFSLSSYHI